MTAFTFSYYLLVDEKKKQSENLKKRYSKKNNNLKRKAASGAGLADIEAAKRYLKEEYGFLAWPEKHLQLCETKTNLRVFRLTILNLAALTWTVLGKRWKLTQFVPKYLTIKQIQTVTTEKNSSCSTTWFVCFTEYWNYFCCKGGVWSCNEKTDANDLFGEMISQELKQFSVRKKAYLKHQYQIW